MVAKAGDARYGRLSAMTQIFCDVKVVGTYARRLVDPPLAPRVQKKYGPSGEADVCLVQLQPRAEAAWLNFELCCPDFELPVMSEAQLLSVKRAAFAEAVDHVLRNLSWRSGSSLTTVESVIDLLGCGAACLLSAAKIDPKVPVSFIEPEEYMRLAMAFLQWEDRPHTFSILPI